MEDEQVAVHLEGIEVEVKGVRAEIFGLKEEVRGLKVHQQSQNGAVNELKLAQATSKGREEERDKWETKQWSDIKWLMATSLLAASVVSGMVFGVLSLIGASSGG